MKYEKCKIFKYCAAGVILQMNINSAVILTEKLRKCEQFFFLGLFLRLVETYIYRNQSRNLWKKIVHIYL